MLFYFKLPNIQSDNYIKHKLFLFISITSFTYVMYLIKKIKNGCIINHNTLIKESLIFGFTAVLGYSLYVDLLHMNWSKDYLIECNTLKQYLYATLFIVSIIVLLQLTNLMFYKQIDICD